MHSSQHMTSLVTRTDAIHARIAELMSKPEGNRTIGRRFPWVGWHLDMRVWLKSSVNWFSKRRSNVHTRSWHSLVGHTSKTGSVVPSDYISVNMEMRADFYERTGCPIGSTKSVEVKAPHSVSSRFICKHSLVRRTETNLRRWRDRRTHLLSVGHSNAARSMCVLDDESMFLSGGRDQRLFVWKVENQNDNGTKFVPFLRVKWDHTRILCWHLEWRADGRTLAIAKQSLLWISSKVFAWLRRATVQFM